MSVTKVEASHPLGWAFILSNQQERPVAVTNSSLMGTRRAALIAALAVVTTALLLAPAARASAPIPALPWLTVAHPAGQRPELVDPQGRTVILRGVNVVGVEDDFYQTPTGKEPNTAPMWPIATSAYARTCPAMSHAAGEAPVCEVQAGLPEFAQSSAPDSHNDFAQMRALGFNFIRLGLSWSQLEPTPRAYSTAYLDRIAQVVGWARQQGIYVLLDMHQDAYSRFTPETAPVNVPPLLTPTQQSSAHADGAPPWAVLADNVPAEAPDGIAEFNSYVTAAFTSFWADRAPAQMPNEGLQEHYIGAMAALARRFKNDSTVVGYEIMNEPLPGIIPPVAFSATTLYPFYAKVIAALTGPGKVTRQSFFFEPMVLRNLEDAPDQVAAPFTSYPNIVYSPHTYTHVFTADAEAGIPTAQSPYPTSYDQAYQVADAEARAMHAALLPGEYGNSAGQDATILNAETAAQDAARVGSAIYAWKGVCGAGSKVADCFNIWSVYAGDPATPPAQNLGLIPSRVTYLSRIYPRATDGTVTSMAYQPGTHAFRMTAIAPGQGAPTLLFIPATAAGNVAASGIARVDHVVRQPDGTRLATVAVLGAGSYTVTVS
jgi:endoglycosylceramidase